jgi:hypothetical protein
MVEKHNLEPKTGSKSCKVKIDIDSVGDLKENAPSMLHD